MYIYSSTMRLHIFILEELLELGDGDLPVARVVHLLEELRGHRTEAVPVLHHDVVVAFGRADGAITCHSYDHGSVLEATPS